MERITVHASVFAAGWKNWAGQEEYRARGTVTAGGISACFDRESPTFTAALTAGVEAGCRMIEQKRKRT